ncbi:hypothetical protein [Burkholderia sp. BCC0397]|uniref:hypothetical protein n=1 Tax=Burkholderia sp. BCC0397 TaxID=486876 RepID=UPI001588A06B|nr:hypothetical protein [Burkholderia sp. BCC0397]
MSRLPIKPTARWIARKATRIASWAIKASRPERLCVYLGHDALAVCHVAGLLNPSVQNKAIVNPGPGAPNLSALLAALGTWLDAHSARGRIDWIVGIEHVRYLLLPWDSRLANEAFCRSLTAALFSQHFPVGIPFTDFQLRFAPLAFGQPRMTALIANDVVHELTAFARRRGCRARRIVPAVSVVWDRFYPRWKKGTGVLALVEGPRLLRVGYDHGHIVTFAVQPFSDRSSAAADSATCVFPPLHPGTPGSNAPQIDSLAPDGDPRLAYALCGVA